MVQQSILNLYIPDDKALDWGSNIEYGRIFNFSKQYEHCDIIKERWEDEIHFYQNLNICVDSVDD